MVRRTGAPAQWPTGRDNGPPGLRQEQARQRCGLQLQAEADNLLAAADEAFLVLDGQFGGLCGDKAWRAGPGSLVFVSHGFTVSETGPDRIIVVVSPGGFDQFVAAAGQQADALRFPEPVPPDPARLTQS